MLEINLLEKHSEEGRSLFMSRLLRTPRAIMAHKVESLLQKSDPPTPADDVKLMIYSAHDT
jgi:hypothetical protein